MGGWTRGGKKARGRWRARAGGGEWRRRLSAASGARSALTSISSAVIAPPPKAARKQQSHETSQEEAKPLNSCAAVRLCPATSSQNGTAVSASVAWSSNASSSLAAMVSGTGLPFKRQVHWKEARRERCTDQSAMAPSEPLMCRRRAPPLPAGAALAVPMQTSPDRLGSCTSWENCIVQGHGVGKHETNRNIAKTQNYASKQTAASRSSDEGAALHPLWSHNYPTAHSKSL